MAWPVFFTRLIEAASLHTSEFSKPSLTLKNAKASAEARVIEAQGTADAQRIEAQGRRDAALIESGDLKILEATDIELSREDPEKLTQEERALRSLTYQQAREEDNVAKVVAHACLDGMDQDIDENAEVDDDLLARIFHEARFVSNSDMQELWGRFTSGAVRYPLNYSYDLLELMKRMDYRKVQEIKRVMPFAINGEFIVGNSILPIDKKFWILLEEWGIVTRSDLFQVSFESMLNDRYEKSFLYGKKVMIAKHDDKDRKLSFTAYKITYVGSQLHSIEKHEYNYNYLEEVARLTKQQGFQVAIADVLATNENGMTQYANPRQI